jgi:hypothetical protein
MDVSALGQACDEFCAIADHRTRTRDPFRQWLTQYRHDGMFDLRLYVTCHDGGYLSQGTFEMVNWIPGDGVYLGYPSERPGGAQNYRYEVPMDAYLPTVRRGR